MNIAVDDEKVILEQISGLVRKQMSDCCLDIYATGEEVLGRAAGEVAKIFVPDTEKCPSSWLIHLRYVAKKSLKNKEKRLD